MSENLSGDVYNCRQCILMQKLELVLSSPLNACCKFTIAYQCNDSEMGIDCCDVNSEDSGSFTSAGNSKISDPTECSKHFPPSLSSKPPRLPKPLSALKAAFLSWYFISCPTNVTSCPEMSLYVMICHFLSWSVSSSPDCLSPIWPDAGHRLLLDLSPRLNPAPLGLLQTGARCWLFPITRNM